ncbi:hypothetical protein RND71_028513 [Anisodus tanguticus]|uniref:Pentatricopeptide repeat-containing protein n=1 Tax=Anisodus tanguticus TaxID=243964 RepID=A0AAE1RJY1_9SOLA|nr:hypothetical protein RND71_028513 [Anisodus tanguticus]
MLRKGYFPNARTYNAIIRGLCSAMEYMDKMKEDGCEPNVQTYNVVIRYSDTIVMKGKLRRLMHLPRHTPVSIAPPSKLPQGTAVVIDNS